MALTLLLDTPVFLWALMDPSEGALLTGDRAFSAFDVACIW